MRAARSAPPCRLTDAEILEVVLAAIRIANRRRPAQAQLDVSPATVLSGPNSTLDTLGLLTLLLDVEEDLQHAGCSVVLSQERALLGTDGATQTVASLAAFISATVKGARDRS